MHVRETMRRHLGKAVAGAALAVTGTAAMVAVTLPGTAGADATPEGDARPAREAAAAPRKQGGIAPGTVVGAPAEGAEGRGRDPLTEDERARALRIAAAGQSFRSAERVDGDRGPQRLGVELAEPEADELDDPSAPRRADATFYDYRDDTLVTRTVNLATGKVEHTGTQRGVQPPLSGAEQTEATRLLIADPLGAGLRADYRDATGRRLTSPGQLRVFAMVYRATPGAGPAAVASCGEQRCARLFPKAVNGPWIDSRHVVINLSTGDVVTLNAR